jgi:hypothetical protein
MNKATFNLNDAPVVISARLIGETTEMLNGLHYAYSVTVKHNGEKCSFKYHTSINDFAQGKDEMSESDLLNALDCLISDAIAGEMDFYNFCNEFGYDFDSRKAEKVWKACKGATKKASRLFSDLYQTADQVREAQGY